MRDQVAELGLGAASLGNLYRRRSDEESAAIVDAAWERGLRFFDTAPLYGHGLSERRLGEALRGRTREDYVVATKAGRLLVARDPAEPEPESLFVDVPALDPVFDFSPAGIRRSVEESLERLGLDRVDICHLHDPEDHLEAALGPAHAELVRLRDEGVIGAIGLGTNFVWVAERFVGRVELDWLLLAGRYTLLDRSADAGLLEACADHGVRVIAAGVFNSGVLADPDGADAWYEYGSVPPDVRVRVTALAAACAARGVALPEAAMQFAARHPAVDVVLVGAGSPDEVAEDHAGFHRRLPAELWADLEVAGRT